MPFAAPAGAMVMVPTDREDAFNLEAEAVEAAITPASKALLIVTPSNPNRRHCHRRPPARHRRCLHPPQPDRDRRRDLRQESSMSPGEHFSIGSLPGMAERTITLDAFSKAYAMTGWRCGYVAAPENVIEAMARVKQVTTGPVATVSQWAGLAALTGPQDLCQRLFRRSTPSGGAVLLDGLDRSGLRLWRAAGRAFCLGGQFVHGHPCRRAVLLCS